MNCASEVKIRALLNRPLSAPAAVQFTHEVTQLSFRDCDVRHIEFGSWCIIMMLQRPSSTHPQPIRPKRIFSGRATKRVTDEWLFARYMRGIYTSHCDYPEENCIVQMSKSDMVY